MKPSIFTDIRSYLVTMDGPFSTEGLSEYEAAMARRLEVGAERTSAAIGKIQRMLKIKS